MTAASFPSIEPRNRSPQFLDATYYSLPNRRGSQVGAQPSSDPSQHSPGAKFSQDQRSPRTVTGDSLDQWYTVNYHRCQTMNGQSRGNQSPAEAAIDQKSQPAAPTPAGQPIFLAPVRLSRSSSAPIPAPSFRPVNNTNATADKGTSKSPTVDIPPQSDSSMGPNRSLRWSTGNSPLAPRSCAPDQCQGHEGWQTEGRQEPRVHSPRGSNLSLLRRSTCPSQLPPLARDVGKGSPSRRHSSAPRSTVLPRRDLVPAAPAAATRPRAEDGPLAPLPHVDAYRKSKTLSGTNDWNPSDRIVEKPSQPVRLGDAIAECAKAYYESASCRGVSRRDTASFDRIRTFSATFTGDIRV